jgi:hypothetical protein
MRLTQANTRAPSVGWVIGVVMLPVGALLWAWSQQPVDDVAGRLAARPFAAHVLDQHKELSGKEADDLSVMSRQEIDTAYVAILDRVNDSTEGELARIRLGMAASAAAFCFWCIGSVGLLLAGSRPPGTVAVPRPCPSVHPGADHASGLALAGF